MPAAKPPKRKSPLRQDRRGLFCLEPVCGARTLGESLPSRVGQARIRCRRVEREFHGARILLQQENEVNRVTVTCVSCQPTDGPRLAPASRKRCCSFATSTARGATFACSARSAAVPAAWPMMKHGPDTRADDWPSCDIDAQRPATKRLSTFFGTMMR